jgi:hypothetical protein
MTCDETAVVRAAKSVKTGGIIRWHTPRYTEITTNKNHERLNIKLF